MAPKNGTTSYRRPPELKRAWDKRCEAEKEVPLRRWLDWPFYLNQMLRFVLAHELGHVIHKDPRNKSQSIVEREERADARGVHILLNYTRGMSPRWKSRRYGRTIAEEGEFITATLTSMTLMFAILDITSRAADELYRQGKLTERWQKDYPPERRRYRAMARYCIEQGLVLEGKFGVSTDLPSPDRVSQIIYGLAADIFWCDLGVPSVDDLPKGGSELVDAAEGALKIHLAGSDDDPHVRRRRLDIVRVRLEQALRQQPEDATLLPVLMRVIAELDQLCTQNETLDAPEDSRVYQHLHWAYLSHWKAIGGKPDPAIEESIWERFVATMTAMGAEPLTPEQEKVRHEFLWRIDSQRKQIQALASDEFGNF